MATTTPKSLSPTFVYAIDPAVAGDALQYGPRPGSTCHEAQDWAEFHALPQLEEMRIAIRLDALRYAQVTLKTIGLIDLAPIETDLRGRTHTFTCEYRLMRPRFSESISFPTDQGTSGARQVETLVASATAGRSNVLTFGFPFDLSHGQTFTFPIDVKLDEQSTSTGFRVQVVADINGRTVTFLLDDHGLPFELHNDPQHGDSSRPLLYWAAGSGQDGAGTLREICPAPRESGAARIGPCPPR
ncbi:MAG: hypothetical protein L0I24_11490 [Pseudonocardia sp.]|nr:hypothetical protein [Pseudonocardia sp.]